MNDDGDVTVDVCVDCVCAVDLCDVVVVVVVDWISRKSVARMKFSLHYYCDDAGSGGE